MNKTKMTEIIGEVFDAGRGDGSLTCGNLGYVNFKPSKAGAIDTISLDGSFSREELEALVFWIKPKETNDDDGAHEVCELCAKLEDENARLRKAALAVITPLIMDTEVHPCDEMDMDKKARACPYQVYALYRLCVSLPNV